MAIENRDQAMNRTTKNLFALLLAATFLAAPASLWAQDLTDDIVDPAEATEDELGLEEDDDEEADRPWSVDMALRSTVGQGTFASVSNDTEFAGEIDDGRGAFNRVNLSWAISPSYQWDDYSFSATLSWVQWLTRGGGVDVTEPRQLRFQDITLEGGWKGHTFENSGITATPSLRMTLPTSKQSRTETLLTNLGASLSLMRTFFGSLTLITGIYAATSFHEFTSPIVEIDTVGHDNILYRTGGAEDVEPGRIAVGGRNIQYQLAPSIAGTFSLPAGLSATVSYALYNLWTYDTANDDELNSPYARPGRGFAQITATSIGLSYGINDWLSASLAANTMQTPKTADNKSFRFPFWNFTGAAANSSSIQFGLSGSY